MGEDRSDRSIGGVGETVRFCQRVRDYRRASGLEEVHARYFVRIDIRILGCFSLEDDSAFELAFPLGEVDLAAHARNHDDLRRKGAGSGGEPGGGPREKYGCRELHQGERGVLLCLGHAEAAPAFKVSVAAAHGGELAPDPFVDAGHIGRSSETGADIVEKSAGVLHDVGVVEALVTNAGIHVEIDLCRCNGHDSHFLILAPRGDRRRQHHRKGEQGTARAHASHRKARRQSKEKPEIVARDRPRSPSHSREPAVRPGLCTRYVILNESRLSAFDKQSNTI